MRLCKCHGVPMADVGSNFTCAVKRRIATAAADKRYHKTEKGRAKRKRSNEKRIMSGDRFVGYAKTAEQAKQINDHIKRRLDEFKSR